MKKGYMEMIEKFYFETWKSVLGSSILHYLRALFVVKIFNFCPDFLGHVGKRLDRKGKVNLKIYDVIDWETK